MTNSWKGAAGILALLSMAGCGARPAALPPPPPVAVAPAVAPTTAAEAPEAMEARAKLVEAQGELTAEHYAAARDLAQATLAQYGAALSPRTRAELLEVVADVQAQLRSPEDAAAAEQALNAWEKVPEAEDDIARAAAHRGLRAQVTDADWVTAERLYLRALALHESKHGPESSAVLWDLHFLIDLYNQQCRVDDLQAMIERLARVYHAHSDQRSAYYLDRYRSYVARRRGDVPKAIALLQRGLDTLNGEEGLRAASAELLMGMALDSGRYQDSLRFLRLDAELSEALLDPEPALQLHFGYSAAGASRKLAAHDAQYGIVSSRAGRVLFPTNLPAIEACTPNVQFDTAWLTKPSKVEQLAASCFEGEPEAEVRWLMRVDKGVVVAAEVAAIGAKAAALRCAVRAVIGAAVPGPHDGNFLRF